jgi:tetratricopeptide (TPR) repeat protein
MTSYEFWEELSKIFNAVVSYQEKSVEFNKRFISPWIRIGNVFDNQDRSREMIAAYKNAIEIAPKNEQHWYDLGNLYLKESNYEDAIHAFQRAIEMNPDMGQAYSDLGTAYLARGDHEQAIACFERSIALLADPKQRSVSWNRLGNLYRKTKQYSLALDAFQHADELDAGKRDTDENDMNAAGNSPDFSFPYQKQEVEEIEIYEEKYGNSENRMSVDAHTQTLVVAGATISDIACNDNFYSVDVNMEAPDVASESQEITSEIEEPALPEPEVAQVIAEIVQLAKGPNEVVDYTEKRLEKPEDAPNQLHDSANNFIEAAYEEYLRNEDMYYASTDLEQSQVLSPDVDRPNSEPVTMIDSLGDVKMEVDIKNPKVWNELGNVYYKNGAIEDAIVAYAKSIELDRCFAWPYSNLALAYVQKERLAESVLLYQHAIELFSSEKDKAIAWNCLGNVYRRMEDYPNAISAYQRADALDPNSISTSLQSQYSLLGTLTQPQETLLVQENERMLI